MLGKMEFFASFGKNPLRTPSSSQKKIQAKKKKKSYEKEIKEGVEAPRLFNIHYKLRSVA